MFCVLKFDLWTFKSGKFGSRKIHVLCKFEKNNYISKQNITKLCSTDKIKPIGTNFVILNIF